MVNLNSLDSLVTIYITLQQKNADEIHKRIRQLRQQMATRLEAIHAQEELFVASQHEILDQLRPHLAGDARSLAFTQDFQLFVPPLFNPPENESGTSTATSQCNPDPTKWHLHSLKTPLKLDPIELMWDGELDEKEEPYTLYFVRMAMQLGHWQHVITVSTQTLDDRSGAIHSPPIRELWASVAGQLRSSLTQPSLGFGASASKTSPRQKITPTQHLLIQELTCLILFITSLFNVYTIADHLSDTCQWLERE